jgi:hypothetical protein
MKIAKIFEELTQQPRYAVIKILKPLAYMSPDYYIQVVPYHHTKNSKIDVKLGSSGRRNISTKNIKVLKTFNDGEENEMELFLKNNNDNKSSKY